MIEHCRQIEALFNSLTDGVGKRPCVDMERQRKKVDINVGGKRKTSGSTENNVEKAKKKAKYMDKMGDSAVVVYKTKDNSAAENPSRQECMDINGDEGGAVLSGGEDNMDEGGRENCMDKMGKVVVYGGKRDSVAGDYIDGQHIVDNKGKGKDQVMDEDVDYGSEASFDDDGEEEDYDFDEWTELINREYPVDWDPFKVQGGPSKIGVVDGQEIVPVISDREEGRDVIETHRISMDANPPREWLDGKRRHYWAGMPSKRR